MSLFSKLFGGGKPKPEPEAEAEVYEGFRIIPTPQSESDGYRLGARIEKEIDGEVKVHHLLRADVIRSLEEAQAFSIRKAKQVIDEQGERIFR
ncbi:HlyU family transcriptional regulator [uncultured Roseovarius sp.]|uniref:HlyU family transcriptional regulator n=1 Tax=uncultured Roseovarius sp. TaxID=293344 RepID=UPI0025F55088|nr:HlyU family transcriptional regulator [uncultured Roseovarius sp.]